MSELATYPLLRGLLIELFELETADAQLPLGILLSMYGTHLRAPLRGLAQWVQASRPDLVAGVQGAQLAPQLADELLGSTYPALNRVLHRLLWDDTSLGMQRLLNRDTYEGAGLAFSVELAAAERDDITRYLCYQSRKAMRLYEPLALLHRLAWDTANRAYLLALLEKLLGISPVVRTSVLDLAAVAHA